MARRIRRILLVCNNYDNFSLEEDGRLDMRVSREYSELNLSGPPVFERVSTTREALQRAESGDRWDLVITMYNVGEVDVFDFAAIMKERSPETPVVLLTSFSREVWRQLESRDRRARLREALTRAQARDVDLLERLMAGETGDIDENIATLPWTEGFENWTTGAAGFSPCWTRFYQGYSASTTSYPYVVAEGRNGSTNALRLYSVYDADETSVSYNYSVAYLPVFDTALVPIVPNRPSLDT